MNRDKLGCYRVGPAKFYSKLEAIDAQQRTGIHLHWDFNEMVFGSIDWTVEPSETILELYRQRAQQLRDQYDYIALMYSGGADSETVLGSFLDNDIKIDEVATYINYDATGDKDNFLNAELWNAALPRTQYLQQQYPWLKHRVIDLTQMTLEQFSNPANRFDWIYNMNMFFTANNVARDNLALKVRDWADIIHSGKKFCVLWGHDKPRIYHENDRFSFRFMDYIDNGPTVRSLAGQQPYANELFYWTPDLPKIMVKQGHLVKNYLNANLDSSPFISQKSTDLAYKTLNGKKYWLSNDGLHSVIYPHWNINTFSVGKPNSILFSPRDQWFMELEESNSARHVWQMGIQKLWQMLPDYWKNDCDDPSHGLKACVSPHYYLEPE
jgi:hypothetical protein